MSFEHFKEKVERYTNALGMAVKFEYDEDKGKYIAKCPNGYMFVGNPISKKMFAWFGKDRYAEVPA